MTRAIRKLPEDCVYKMIDSPVGGLVVVAREGELHSILWHSDLENSTTAVTLSRLTMTGRHPVIDETQRQLTEYFSHGRKTFDLPIVFNGTEFQQLVWRELLKIPYGKYASYEEQAIKVGGREKVRAVGMANGMNPISIVVPCHRVIGKNGALTGFGGGLQAKRYLLELEQNTADFALV